MSTAVMTERITQTSPSLKARIAGVFYFLCFVTGITALFLRGRLGLRWPNRGRLLRRGDAALLLHFQASEPEALLARCNHQPRGMRNGTS